mmetsp:Transcript_107171/g.300021  ORF Transcript_107171/g.300021 Transcript_107171/m.300021 type:complete len:339 (-) Transcript_107171:133-1149(-)
MGVGEAAAAQASRGRPGGRSRAGRRRLALAGGLQRHRVGARGHLSGDRLRRLRPRHRGGGKLVVETPPRPRRLPDDARAADHRRRRAPRAGCGRPARRHGPRAVTPHGLCGPGQPRGAHEDLGRRAAPGRGRPTPRPARAPLHERARHKAGRRQRYVEGDGGWHRLEPADAGAVLRPRAERQGRSRGGVARRFLCEEGAPHTGEPALGPRYASWRQPFRHTGHLRCLQQGGVAGPRRLQPDRLPGRALARGGVGGLLRRRCGAGDPLHDGRHRHRFRGPRARGAGRLADAGTLRHRRGIRRRSWRQPPWRELLVGVHGLRPPRGPELAHPNSCCRCAR